MWVAGRKVHLEPTQAVGKGGEADVYAFGGVALKLFKGPDHPDLAGDPDAQEAARLRLEEHQHKLPAFPRGLPERVVAPHDLVTTRRADRVLGYTMAFLKGAEVLYRYGDRGFRQSSAVSAGAIVSLFSDLHATLARLHDASVVIGDFNDLNVLVTGSEAHLIDADSFQYGSFPCRMYTERFVDPTLCDGGASRPVLVKAHNRMSDWYAFAVMLFRSLLFVDPYGGIYKPRPSGPRVAPPARPLRRITVFHPDVRYPKPALSPHILPDDLLHHFHGTFVNDARGEFPLPLLAALRFTRCTVCGAEHARATCPSCHAAARAAVREVVTVRGRVKASVAFRTDGTILWAGVQDGRLRVAAHEHGVIKREDGRTVLEGPLPRDLRVGVSGERTLLGRGDTLVILSPGREAERRTLDTVGVQPCFDATARRAYWIQGGALWAEGALGAERTGDVLGSQTRFWVGPHFGFGFYRAGELAVAFVFGADAHVLNDGVRLAGLPAHLVDATCAFGEHRVLFVAGGREGAATVQRAWLIGADGTVLARAETDAADGSWLGGLRGACVSGPYVFVPTDEGIVRAEVQEGRLVPTKEFPDTEPFVDRASRLLPTRDGLYVVGLREIRLLRVA